MDMEQIGAAIARQEVQIKELSRRMDVLEKLAESVNSLAISVERVAGKQDSMDAKINDLTQDVDVIKDRPAKNWYTIVAALISALVGAGTWGANHARIYKAHPFADVVAVCELNGARPASAADDCIIQRHVGGLGEDEYGRGGGAAERGARLRCVAHPALGRTLVGNHNRIARRLRIDLYRPRHGNRAGPCPRRA